MATPNPYGDTAEEYLIAGWHPLPLPLGKKSAPPKGYTGKEAPEAPEALVMGMWMDKPGNVATRLPRGILGIDVDINKSTREQIGWESFQKLVEELGPIPIEVVSTSHDSFEDGFTAFFSVPEDIEWDESEAGSHIDLIHRGYRYQVVAPSIHPESTPESPRAYQWRMWEDGAVQSVVPDVADFPPLPSAWVERLTRKTPTQAPERPQEERELYFPTDVPATLGEGSCASMRAKTGRRVTELKGMKNGRHATMVSSVMVIVLMGHSGHQGMQLALTEYFTAWSKGFSPQEAAGRNLRGEFNAAVVSAQEKMKGPQKPPCNCSRPATFKKVRNMADIRRPY